MIKIYGIKNCDTIKKFLKEINGITEYEFIDFKKVQPTVNQIKCWEMFLGELPVNKRGTTYRKIKEEYEKANKNRQITILREYCSMIKRPIVEKNNKVIAIGYDKELSSKIAK